LINKSQLIKVFENTSDEDINNILFLDKRKTSSVVFKYKNNLELLDLVVHLYCLVVIKTHLSPREKIALRHYLHSGYNELTREAIRKECKMGVSIDKEGNEVMDKKKSMANINQINFKLERKGILVRRFYHDRDKEVNKDLIKLKDRFMKGGCEILNIKFNKEL